MVKSPHTQGMSEAELQYMHGARSVGLPGPEGQHSFLSKASPQPAQEQRARVT